MGRAEAGTPKYLANKMKAKGLQKLRWYCQMCEKQCRDENGFKCHTMSESHQRQLLLFADSPGKFLHNFSKEFSDGYLELLRRRFGTKRTNANKIYQEYIAHKEHIHMNATRWLTLSDYVKWLGRTGQVVADETEKGWFVSYIDRSPEAMERQAKAERKEKMEKDDEERMTDFIEKQIKKAKSKDDGDDSGQEKYTELVREEAEPLKLDIRLEKKFQPESILGKSALLAKRPNSEIDEKVFKKPRSMLVEKGGSHSKSALDEIIQQEEAKKERANRKDYWLHKNIVAHLETVIPAMGKTVLVVNGAYRGSEALLKKLDERKFSVSIEILHGPLKGRIVDNVQYEDISKLYDT
ncbi:GL25134 [Drosophila persimilis]|uniref:GL25134 n=1 Tax=Drosophila persimilis TaxID=7234 RepID=B4GR21_DROPE|nr:GL25134 [Drosophila persimilis]